MIDRRVALGLVLLLAALVAPAAAFAQNSRCQGVITYRLWSENQEYAFEFGETVEIVTGKDGHLYFMVRGSGASNFQTVATIGYPNEHGGKETIDQVLPHVRMEAQNAEDIGNGRIRFRAEKPGLTALGYTIDEMVPPGRLDRVPQSCRKGRVKVRVMPPPPPEPPPEPPKPALTSDQAAGELVALLYRGLLRRGPSRQTNDESFVIELLQHHRRGVQNVAEIMMESLEFREEALKRTRNRYPHFQSPQRLREALLADIYRTLYGKAEPSRTQLYENLEDLETCLGTSATRVETCGRLGRELVGSPLFDQAHRDWLTAVETAPLTPPEPPKPTPPGGG